MISNHGGDAAIAAARAEILEAWGEVEAIVAANQSVNADPRQDAISAKIADLRAQLDATPATTMQGLCLKILALEADNPGFASDFRDATLESLVADAKRLMAEAALTVWR